MRFFAGVSLVLLMAGCASPPPAASIAHAPSPAAMTLTETKRIARDGEQFILPDGTRVRADERGGFRLPNGDYVAALTNGLLLPNGVQCPEDDAGGYVCP